MQYEIEQARYQAETALGSFKSNLDEYRAKSNYNAGYYQDRVNHLVNIREYILLLERALVAIEQERQSAYQEGYRKGYDKANNETRFGGHSSAKAARFSSYEGARAASIDYAQVTWPELY